jgi:hypothetical protein
MYTSCGWFFDEISGIETVQILRYAGRALTLIRELNGLDFELGFERLLESAPSNVPKYMNGKRIYELQVKPAHISFENVAAHYGLSTLLPDAGFWSRLSDGCWHITEKTVDTTKIDAPSPQVSSVGEVAITSMITWEEKKFIFAANYRGGTSVVCGILPATEETRKQFVGKPEVLLDVFSDMDEKKMTEIFGSHFFSLRDILKYAQRAMVNQLLRRDTEQIESSLRDTVHGYYGLFEYLATLNIEAPSIISASAGIVLTSDVVHGLEDENPDIEVLRGHLEHARQWSVTLDSGQIVTALKAWTIKHMHKIYDSPTDFAEMERVRDVLTLFIDEFKWHIGLYESQNLYYATQNKLRQQLWQGASGIHSAFYELGKTLRFAEEALN